jgi:hypothetical protein
MSIAKETLQRTEFECVAEFTEGFAHCWNAAGSHIQRMAGGDLMSWLKETLASVNSIFYFGYFSTLINHFHVVQ